MHHTIRLLRFCLALLFLWGCDDEPTVEDPEPIILEAPPEEEPEAPVEKPQTLSPRRFLEVRGNVKVDKTTATVNSTFKTTSIITVGKGGYAVLTFEPGSIVELRENTTVRLGRSKRKKFSLKLDFGTLWSFLAPKSSYEVVAPNAVLGARGTTFFVDSPKAKSKKKSEMYACVCHGNVDIKTKKVKKVSSPNVDHKAFFIQKKGKKTKLKKSKMLKHKNKAMKRLVKLQKSTVAAK